MRKLWHIPARLLLIARAVVPMYLSYLWLWGKWRWLGRRSPPEVWRRLHAKSADRFYRLAVRMRGGLIKVGQIISTRVDLMPAEWTSRLASLQDQVEPTPWPVIERRLTHELGAPPHTVFASIDQDAVAAASFGQVHRATTKDGRAVALKVQYEDVRLKLQCDMFVLRCAVPLFNIFVPKVRLRTIYEEIRAALETELDYRQEAEYTRRIGANLRALPHVFVPEVVEEYTTQFVICTTYFDGFKVTDAARREQEGLETRDVIEKILGAYAQMFFVDGVFQSDPHPGNLLLRRGPEGAEICILDFGQAKVLPREFQRKLVQASIAFMGRDVDNFARAVVALGLMNARDVEVAKPILREFFEEIFELSPTELKKLDAQAIKAKLQDVLARIEGVTIPQDIVLYGRAFSLLAGVVAALDPDVNGLIVAKPMIMKALMRPENFAPLAGC